jgi:hypothetical protein
MTYMWGAYDRPNGKNLVTSIVVNCKWLPRICLKGLILYTKEINSRCISSGPLDDKQLDWNFQWEGIKLYLCNRQERQNNTVILLWGYYIDAWLQITWKMTKIPGWLEPRTTYRVQVTSVTPEVKLSDTAVSVHKTDTAVLCHLYWQSTYVGSIL